MSAGASSGNLQDLYFGEALYSAQQKEYFDAISRLDTELAQYYGLDEPNLNSLYHHIDSAEFSVGDFELYYRMHTRAGRAIKAVIEGNVDESVRNEAIYRLAKIYYQKQQPLNALHTIERLKGVVPEDLRYAEPYLRAQIYMANGKFTDAIKLLKDIEGADSLKGFSGYNLGVALFQSGNEEDGIAQLDKVGQKELALVKQQSSVHYYVGHFPEIDCISVKESAYAGCVPVVSSTAVFGSLDKKERQYLIRVAGDSKDKLTQEKSADLIIKMLKDDDFLKENQKIVKDNLNQINNWTTIAEKWLEIF